MKCIFVFQRGFDALKMRGCSILLTTRVARKIEIIFGIPSLLTVRIRLVINRT